MTVSIPELPQLGIMGTLYLMALGSFIVCWLASRQGSSNGFWVFISVLSGGSLVVTFAIATFLLIANGCGPR
jgi:uncharacterized membrane protein